MCPMYPIRIKSLSVHWSEKVSHSLKKWQKITLTLFLEVRPRNQTQSIKNTEEKIKELSEEEVEKLLNNYEAKFSGQMVKSLGKSIINMYSMGACAVLGISNQEALSEDLENDPFLNSALQRFTCKWYYRFRSFLAPLSVGIITSRHYLSECNKNGGTNGTSNERTAE